MSYNINIKKLEFFKDEYTNCFFVSNIKYTWKFILDNKQRTVILLYTKLFGKRIIYLDNKEIYNSSKYTYNFNISFPIEFYNITITQKDYFYTLKINNISFNNIMNDLKLKKFNILEDTYKEKQKQKKLKRLKKRKNRILLNAINNFNKKDITHTINLGGDENSKNKINRTNTEIVNSLNKLDAESNNDEDDDSRTIHQSFEINDKTLAMINNISNSNNNINNINNISNINNTISNRNNNISSNILKDKKSLNDKKKGIFGKNKSLRSSKKNKFKTSEKFKFKTYEYVNSSINEMINTDLVENETINSDVRNTNLLRNNIFSSNNISFLDKGSMTTQSN